MANRTSHGDLDLASIEGLNILITGGSRGLGLALAHTLAAAGGNVVITARGQAPLDAAVGAIRSSGGNAFGIRADIADKDAIYPVAHQAVALTGPTDVLIHNASTLGPTPLRLLLDSECEDFDDVIATNLVGPFRLTKAVAGSMTIRGTGLVIAISSDAAAEAYPEWGFYSATKAAHDHLQRIFAAELGGTGVRFLSVDPGEMDTEMHAAAIPEADPSSLARPGDVARAIAEMIARRDHLDSGSRLSAADFLPPAATAEVA